ncbi:MAG: hypothetical protein JKY52_01265 [Flavobacteriales bacterium]|nr:hypothetical protein [Flavobacteriales bacterium]
MKNTLLILLALISLEGFCCSCIGFGEINEEQYNSYDLIVKGQIEKIEEGAWTRTIYVRIEKEYKGNVKSELVLITSPSQSGICGIFPKTGETWLMYANKSENTYSTDLCTRTKSLNPKAWNYNKEEIESDLVFLEKRLKQK